MHRRLASAVVGVLALLVITAASSWAAWQDQGIPVVSKQYEIRSTHAVPDGNGGFIVCWEENHPDTGRDIYVQRVDENGNLLWQDGGIPLCAVSNDQFYPTLVSDHNGGAIVAWLDYRDGAYIYIYAQRIDSTGTALWTANGVEVTPYGNSPSNHQLVADEYGNVIVVWQDYYPSSDSGNNIYAQRLSSTGDLLWSFSGVAICTEMEDQFGPRATSDGAGGAIVTWLDDRNGVTTNVYAQRVDYAGSILWTLNGRPAADEGVDKSDLAIVSDGAGGAIIKWRGGSLSNTSIYAQRMDSSGERMWDWMGEDVCSAGGSQSGVVLLADNWNGAFLAWSDSRNGESDIYVQHLNSAGQDRWTNNGVAVCTAAGSQVFPSIVSDGNNGIIVMWTDYRNDYPNFDIYTQRIDSSGLTRWATDGVAMCSAQGKQDLGTAVSDGNGGIIGVWVDSRPSIQYTSLYAQRLGPDGYWSSVAPVIVDLRDVPGDQGGLVNLAWDASRLDYGPEHSIGYYTLWRAIATANSADMKQSPQDALGIDLSRPDIRSELIGTTTWYWEQVGDVYAYQLEGYAKAVPTLFDSTSVSTEYNYFEVIAHTYDPDVFWVSNVDSCRSVDNLAPLTPSGLQGQLTSAPFGLSLSWQANTEGDLASYAIYRGTSEDFVPDESNLLGTTEETRFFDGEWVVSAGYFYKVSARDIHENESDFAILAPDQATAVGDLPTTHRNVLYPNAPNPFNPRTTLAFEIATDGPVSLRIYDTSGRMVRELVNETLEAGPHQVIWDGRDDQGREAASGAYFVRLAGRDFTRSQKVLLSK